MLLFPFPRLILYGKMPSSKVCAGDLVDRDEERGRPKIAEARLRSEGLDVTPGRHDHGVLEPGIHDCQFVV